MYYNDKNGGGIMKKYEHEYVSLYLPSVWSFGKFEEHKEIINSYGEMAGVTVAIYQSPKVVTAKHTR